MMNKGDAILIVILAASVAFFGANEWNIIHDFEQFTAGSWTCFAVIFGGELLSFALYKIGKFRSTKNHDVVDRLENGETEKENERKSG